MSQHFLKPKSLGANVKVEFDLPSYATKSGFKKMQQQLIHQILLKRLIQLKFDVDKLDIDKLKNIPNKLSNLKSKVDQLDIEKSVPVPVDLIKLNDAAKT